MCLVNPKLLLVSCTFSSAVLMSHGRRRHGDLRTATTLASAISWSVILPSADEDLLLTFSVITQPIMFIGRFFMALVCP